MARGKVIRQKFIKRANLRENPETYYLFGDNIRRSGFGGQAAAMRGEPNAIGIPTKWAPHNGESAFFRDDDNEMNPIIYQAISIAFKVAERVLMSGHNVVIPAYGLGTGRGQLATHAPKILAFIEEKIRELETGQVDGKHNPAKGE